MSGKRTGQGGEGRDGELGEFMACTIKKPATSGIDVTG